MSTVNREQFMILDTITFPEITGVRCQMMPFIQGDSKSLPEEYSSYADIIDKYFLEKGEIGHLTIDESFVTAGTSQRGYNSKGVDRNVHIEVGTIQDKYRWGYQEGGAWGGQKGTFLKKDTQVLIANSISDTCRVWDREEERYTKDGDLSEYLDDYPEQTGVLMKAGELRKIGILTPHECINQFRSGWRQFLRIVGKGVQGREPYFTINPLVTF